MENATKALLIAAGMLLAVMIVSLLVVGYNRISAHYNQQTELLTAEQLDKFNKQFQNYNREDIRGNELISLMNKIIDYNVRQSYQVGTNYERIKVTITIGDNSILEQFIDYGTGGGTIIDNVITNTNSSGNKYADDRELVKIANTPHDLIKYASLNGINDLTDTQLQKLAMEIDTIMVNETATDNRSVENRRIRAIVLKNILYQDISSDPSKINVIKEIVNQYYQYTKFKRAYFECTDLIMDPATGRVVEMDFKVKTKTDAYGNKIVQFD